MGLSQVADFKCLAPLAKENVTRSCTVNSSKDQKTAQNNRCHLNRSVAALRIGAAHFDRSQGFCPIGVPVGRCGKMVPNAASCLGVLRRTYLSCTGPSR